MDDGRRALPPPAPRPVLQARGEGRLVALTFESGPGSAALEALLDVLADHDALATFCFVGHRLGDPGMDETLHRAVREGHELATQGMEYTDMGRWSAARVEADLRESLMVMYEVVGPMVSVPWFRAPLDAWGSTPRAAVRAGLQPLGFTHDIGDRESLAAGLLAENVRAAVRGGGVVVSHDGGGERGGSLAALARVLPEMVTEGWRFTLPAQRPLAAPCAVEP